MRIQARRIRSLERHLAGVPHGAPVVVTSPDLGAFEARLRELGLSDLNAGEARLPRPVGSVSAFNAEGRGDVHRDQPMETVFRAVHWEWTEFHGPYEVPQSGIRDVPYQRYPRTFVPPPSVEVTVVETTLGTRTLAAPAVPHLPREADLLRHIVNLFLEMFGECALLAADLEPYVDVPTRRLNWSVLPPGEFPWSRLQKNVEPILAQMGERLRPVAEHRLQLLTETHKPDFVAVGRGGFSGYLVFGFEAKKLYIVESLQYGNATYVFDGDWERLSAMTKREILDQELHRDRLVHVSNWDEKVHRLVA